MFNLSYEDASYKVSNFSSYTLYQTGGGRTIDFAGGGGADVYISKNGNYTNSPRGVILMHELIGHGHPAGENNAYQVDGSIKTKWDIKDLLMDYPTADTIKILDGNFGDNGNEKENQSNAVNINNFYLCKYY